MENKKVLEGVTYNILEEDQIEAYVRRIAKEEWSFNDFEECEKDLSLNWALEEVRVSDIKPNEELLKTEKFQLDLKPRIIKIRDLLNNNQAVPPLILRGLDYFIFDGYARYHVLKEKRIEKCLAYVGRS
ncbi:MAG: hypothetical protein Q8Q48_03710 [Candidatus Staskawiczbacteria bacterium]|nr:hypothetical protein [Candidatus Staskawiczbacteria bacterium]